MADKIGKWLREAQQHVGIGHSEAAEELCRKILDIDSEHAEAMLVLARALYFRRQIPESIEILESLLAREPDKAEARILLIYGHVESGGHAQAIALAHDVLEQSAHPGELLAAYMAFDTMCDWEHAKQLQARILGLAAQGDIDNALMPSLLLNLNAAQDIPPERIFEAHRVWANVLERETRQQQLSGKVRTPKEGKLKIAYLSADFCQHPVGHFIQSPITHHDRDRFEVYCYAHVATDDARTARIRQTADHFIDVTQLSPHEIAQRIHRDGIHILVELGGHTALSRLQALAFRPAPVQITYLGYPNTTGLSTVDFRITDAFAEDTEQGTQYVEKLLYMPQSFLCASEFMQNVPRIEATPAAKNGHITFGSFNHVRKLNPETIALWSRILQGVEGSRLVIKSKGCEVDTVCENILAIFAHHGIDRDRIRFYAPMQRHAEHAAIYNEVDIALDSFPYNGTTTTCETLWMGVPVVSLVGPQHVQRTSYSILKNIGLDATIAHTPDEYVEKAINLSRSIDNLNILRQTLPTLIKHSPLGQPEAFTRQIEALYLDAWQAKGFALPAAPNRPAPAVAPQALPGTKAQRRLLLCDRLDPLIWHALRTHCDAVASGDSDAWLVIAIPPVAQQQRISINIQRYVQLNYIDVQQPANVHLISESRPMSLESLLTQCAATYIVEPEGDLPTSEYQDALKDAADRIDCPGLPVTRSAVEADRAAVQPMPPLQDLKVTVCMPTYNRCELLKRAVDSITSQDYENLELLISDNASDDDTEAFCRELAAHDPRVRYHRNATNLGADKNFFQLYGMIATDLFVFCSDDDFLQPDFLQKAVDMYRAHPDLGMVYGQCNVVDMDGTVINRLDFGHTVDCIVDPRHELLESHLRNQIIWTSSMMRKTATDRMLEKSVSMFGLDFHGIGQGTDYLFGVLMLSEVPSGYIDAVCANFTINPDSVSATLLDRGLDADVFTLPRAHALYDALYGGDAAAKRALRAGILLRSQRLQATLEQTSRLPAEAQQDALGRIGTLSEQLNALLEQATEQPSETPQTPEEPTPLTLQDWSRHTTDVLKAYGERPQDETARDQLRALRAMFVQSCLSMQAGELASAFPACKETYRQLLLSGFRYEPWIEDEEVLVQGVLQQLAQHPAPQGIAALLAAMLYSQPHDLPLCPTPEELPAWCLDLYLDFMHTIPEIFQRPGEAERYRQTMRAWIDIVHAGITASQAPAWRRIGEHFSLKANFIPIYMTHGNLKDLYVKRAEIIAAYLEMQGNRLEHRFGPRPASRQKIRLGILANHFTPQTETFSTIPFFEHLDRSRFEIILLSLGEAGHRLEQYCRERADRFVHLQGSIPESAARIRDMDLDMLLLASNVTAVSHQVTMLGLYRLARVQISSVASCVTSGMPHVDHYISGSYTEPERDAQAQYRERLVMVDGPAHCYNFATENEPPKLSIDRKQLGIPENAVVYASGSNYYKITPEVEAAWARILADNPDTHLLLYPFNPNWSNSYATQPFITRLISTFQRHGVDQKRITLLQPLAHQPDIKAILALVDVYLDSFPFAGVTSLLDPLAVGLPIVSMQGDGFRSMMGGALLRELHVDELIAKDLDAYLALATRLGQDAEFRQRLRDRIQAGMQASPRFLDSQTYGRHIQTALLDMAAESLGLKDTEPCL